MQSVSFTGTAAGFGIGVDAQTEFGFDAGALSCNFNGGSYAPGETSVSGTGHVTGNCTGTGLFGPVSISCSFDYFREGALVEIVGSCTITAQNVLGQTVTVTVTAAGAFVFIPAPGIPTTSYQLVGVAAGVGP